MILYLSGESHATKNAIFVPMERMIETLPLWANGCGFSVILPRPVKSLRVACRANEWFSTDEVCRIAGDCDRDAAAGSTSAMAIDFMQPGQSTAPHFNRDGRKYPGGRLFRFALCRVQRPSMRLQAIGQGFCFDGLYRR